ncbi:MAG TPA: hypothetical protein VN723_11055 [Rhizomicrobium sp.]|nr:hypothetical protein [Rhizomicrobium sp.]
MARSSFGKRGGPVAAGIRPRARAAAGAPVSVVDEAAQPMVATIFSAGDIGFSDFHEQRAAWICGGIIALMVMTVVLLFGFSFGSLMRGHDMAAALISGLMLFLTAGLAMAGAVYGGSLMADADKRHNLRFAILILVFAVELLLFLFGEAVGKPKGVSWLLFGALISGFALWARLKYDRMVATVAELTAEVSSV